MKKIIFNNDAIINKAQDCVNRINEMFYEQIQIMET